MEQTRTKLHRTAPIATERARELRQKTTPPERTLWSMLRNRRLGGLKFRRQMAIGKYVVDFYCAEASLVIELDGDNHTGLADYDNRRTRFLASQGLHVLRVTNSDLIRHREATGELILRTARSRVSDRPHTRPLPQPSP